ncbi:hypothetical protein X943_002732 [Babesia divergens]|uniref:Uncharacterized protein n=1 Tax=Babesia divergens TaxID=32595 RepID=A0AAD9GAJ0_BABDI|nr:hypothetical protein X943_002732 [Babesia divergens]
MPGCESTMPSATASPTAGAAKYGMENASSTAESHIPYTVASPISPGVRTVATSNVGTTVIESPLRADMSSVSQLPTVYLPPLHYTYDRATGKLIQITQGDRTPTTSMPIPPTTSLNTTTVSTTNTVPISPVKSTVSHVTCTTSAAPNITPRLGQSYTPHISQMTRPVSRLHDPNANMRQVPQFDFHHVPHANVRPIQMMQQPVPGTYTTQFHHPTSYENVPAFSAPAPQVMRGHIGEMGGQLTFDTNSVGYMAEPQRMVRTQDMMQSAPHIGGVQGFASTLQKGYDSAAHVFRSFDNISMNNVTEGIKNVLHPCSSEYMKAAVFKLQRLENVPLNTHATNMVAYSLVVYFDTATDNYDVYRSPQRWAIPTEHAHLVHCDLRGDIVKIPWRGEPYVFLKVVEHCNQAETVVGRLKLHIDSLVRQHPLRVSIISDNNAPCGHAILEFDVGHMSQQEMRDAQEETLRSAERRQKMDYQFRANRMPDYESYMQQQKALQRDRRTAEYAPPQTHYRQRSHPSTLGEVQIPAALNHFVRWCCDITDSDLY